MDHDMVVRRKMTERYLLDELDPAARDEFEEHFFDCKACALDVRAGALFVEQSQVVLAEKVEPVAAPLPATAPGPAKPGWLSWFRPAGVVPVMVLLLAVIGYQDLVIYPQLQHAVNRPQVLPWASVNVGTYGSEGPVIKGNAGGSFLLFVRIPAGGIYSRYNTAFD